MSARYTASAPADLHCCIRLAQACSCSLVQPHIYPCACVHLVLVANHVCHSKGFVAGPCCRDSKLTRILEDSLGGNCKTTMLAMISPALEAYSGEPAKWSGRSQLGMQPCLGHRFPRLACCGFTF